MMHILCMTVFCVAHAVPLVWFHASSVNLMNHKEEQRRTKNPENNKEGTSKSKPRGDELPWLFPMARVRKEHIMPRPSVMLRSNRRVG